MKLLTLLLLLSTSVFAQEQYLLDCQVTKIIDSNIFEESLSVHEYPDVAIIKDDFEGIYADIGAMLPFSAEYGYSVQAMPRFGFNVTYKIESEEDSEFFIIHVEMVTENGQKPYRAGTLKMYDKETKALKTTIANIKCD